MALGAPDADRAVATFPATVESVTVMSWIATSPPPAAAEELPTATARLDVIADDVTVMSCSEETPPPAMDSSPEASLPFTVTRFNLTEPIDLTPAPPSTAAPPVIVR